MLRWGGRRGGRGLGVVVLESSGVSLFLGG